MGNNSHNCALRLGELTPERVKNTIVHKEKLSDALTLIEVRAPLIAASAKAGQFVMVWSGENSERLPLTISDWDADKGTITLIFQEVGAGRWNWAASTKAKTFPASPAPLAGPPRSKITARRW